MSQLINTYTIEINSPLADIWHAITTSSGWTAIMPEMTVVTDWQTGSDIDFACYNPDGSVTEYEGIQLRWRGTIADFVELTSFTVDYYDGKGVVSETYELHAEGNLTRLTFTQETETEEQTKYYSEGNMHTLNSIKNYVERNTN